MAVPSGKVYTKSQDRIRKRYGPWALITGASDGIGREFTHRIAEAGVHVAMTARRQSLLQDMSLELSERHQIQSLAIGVDLSSGAGIEELLKRTRTLDIGLLVSSAGFGSSGPFLNSAIETEINMLHLNCRAVLSLSHAFGLRFSERKRGGMIFMSSLVAFQGVPHCANYAATKAYVQSFAEALNVEWKTLGLDVIISAPGPVHSGFAKRAGMTMGAAQSPREVAGITLNALGRRSLVRPGWLSKFLEWSLRTLPRWGRVRMMGRIMAGMAAKKGKQEQG